MDSKPLFHSRTMAEQPKASRCEELQMVQKGLVAVPEYEFDFKHLSLLSFAIRFCMPGIIWIYSFREWITRKHLTKYHFHRRTTIVLFDLLKISLGSIRSNQNVAMNHITIQLANIVSVF